MAAGLNVSSVKVERPEGLVENAALSIRANRAKLTTTRRRTLVAERDDVMAVVHVSRKVWRVDFADETSWTVTHVGCGCGG